MSLKNLIIHSGNFFIRRDIIKMTDAESTQESELSAVEGTDRDLHPIFQSDPADFMQYVGKEVCVFTEDGTNHAGRCYTVDPVSQSVVLAKMDNENSTVYQLKVVMGHCVRDIVVLDEDNEKYKNQLDSLFKSAERLQCSPEELKEKRDMLKSWLLKNRIPIEVSGENSEILSISDALFIEPPYGADNCRSTNEIILGRVQGLITNMPNDIEEW